MIGGVLKLLKNTTGQFALSAGAGAIAGAMDSSSANDAIEGAARGAFFGVLARGALGAIPKAGKALGGFAVNQKGIRRAYQMNNPIGPRMQHGGFTSGFGPVTRTQHEAMSYMHQIKKAPLSRAATGTARGALAAGKFAARHPVGVLATVGAGVGGVALYNSALTEESPTLAGAEVNVQYNKQRMAAHQMGQIGTGTIGSAPEMMQRHQEAIMMQQLREAGRSARSFRNSTRGLVQGLHSGRHG